MEKDVNTIYEKLMAAYYEKGKIGNVKPFNNEHAKKIAWSAACRIANKK